MSVLLETSVGDITIDLLTDYAPKCAENFLKLCKIKYYNFSPITSIQPGRFFQTGDPLGFSPDTNQGSSIWGLLDKSSRSARTFAPEFHPKLKHTERGTVSMATIPSAHDSEEREAASQFLITLGDERDDLDGKAAIFGKVVEGFDTLEKINGAFADLAGRPLQDIRIRHTHIIEEADIPDPAGLAVPPASPLPTPAQLATVRIADDEVFDNEPDQAALEKLRAEREAKANALTLELLGDLPSADVAPPENVLFVCKLNPVTRDDDLRLIFSRFGEVLSCEVIRDKRRGATTAAATPDGDAAFLGESLQYAFVEFADRAACERAYFKMQGVLIDDHRIHVDFSQSASKLADVWRDGMKKRRRGAGGGWGGIEGLEKKTQYRAQEAPRRSDGSYGMMFGGKNGSVRGRGERDGLDGRPDARDRSRSPRRRRERSRDRYDEPPRSRHRSRSRERDRHRERRRDDRDRDSHRRY